MTDKNNGGPAFPLATSSGSNTEVNGMSLRDYFAAKAMQSHLLDDALARQSDTSVEWLQKVAKAAYEMADAMLKAREE